MTITTTEITEALKKANVDPEGRKAVRMAFKNAMAEDGLERSVALQRALTMLPESQARLAADMLPESADGEAPTVVDQTITVAKEEPAEDSKEISPTWFVLAGAIVGMIVVAILVPRMHRLWVMAFGEGDLAFAIYYLLSIGGIIATIVGISLWIHHKLFNTRRD